MIAPGSELSVARQAKLLGISRSSVYYRPRPESPLDEAGKSAWCREHGVYPQELEQWRESATQALAEPEQHASITASLNSSE